MSFSESSGVPAKNEDSTNNETLPQEEEIPQNQNDQNVALDMTDMVESMLSRMVSTNESALQKLTDTISNHLAKITGNLEPLVAALGQNTGKLPVDQQHPAGRNTGKLPVGQADGDSKIDLVVEKDGPLDDGAISLVATTSKKRTIISNRSSSRSRESASTATKSLPGHRGRSTNKSPSTTTPTVKSRGGSRGATTTGTGKNTSHHHRKSTSTITSAADDKDKQLEDDQMYWSNQVAEYEENQKFGPEVSSSLAGASKVFWSKSVTDEKTKRILETSKIPTNCKFLSVKAVNKEIWSCAAGDIRSRDWALQKIQATHSSMAANMLQAASDLDVIKDQLKVLTTDHPGINIPSIKSVVDKLRDSLKLAGRTNIKISTHRRESFKSSIPKELNKLVDQPEVKNTDSTLLFGDNLKNRMEEIKGDNSVRKELEKHDSTRFTFKRKLDNFSASKKQKVSHNYNNQQIRSNWKTPLNTQSGSGPGYQAYNTKKHQKPQRQSNQRQNQNRQNKQRNK